MYTWTHMLSLPKELIEMNLKLKQPTNEECILFHDFYSESSEPDAPKKKFEYLTDEEKSVALDQFHPEDHISAFEGNNLIGFAGISPDDKSINVDIFYIISPLFRGQGYLSKLLEALVNHCQENYKDYKFIRALTLKENIPSIKGLLKASFVCKGEYIEEVQPDVKYQKFLFQLQGP